MIGIEASPTTQVIAAQVIAALVAAALYVAPYLSFVRLLRYPRNWHPPSLPASLTTGVLAALAVALVALAPRGCDRPALAVSIGFVVVLLGLVVALWRRTEFTLLFQALLSLLTAMFVYHVAIVSLSVPYPSYFEWYRAPHHITWVFAISVAVECGPKTSRHR